MSVFTPGTKLSIDAGDTIPAFRVVAPAAGRTCVLWETSSSHILGVCERLTDSGASAPIILNGTAKCECNSSIAALQLVGPATGGSGKVAEVDAVTATALPKVLGIALEGGTSSSIIEVAIQITNRTCGI